MQFTKDVMMFTVLGTVLSFIFACFFDAEIIELIHHNDSDFAVLLKRGTFDNRLMLKLFYRPDI